MATTEIGELLIRIRADMAKLEEALKKSGTQVKSFSDKVTATSKNLTSAGLKLSLAVTAPLVLIGKKAIDSAMDVVESENLFEVSMGNMAKAARGWSEEFAKSVGLNEYNVRRNVGIFNVMFDSMGIGEQKAYDMAKGLTELSYDMASFYNLDVEDAFTKLQAGITGEIEPLKRLGIVINETTVAQYAYNNGIAEQGAKLTEQEKISARYLAIMDQTSKAQGDLARTLDSPANKMRIFKEQISLAMVELGQGLIPVILKVVDIIKPYVEKFANASDETKTFVTVLGLIAAATGPTLLFFGSVLKAVGTLRTGFITLNIATKGWLSTIGVLLIPALILAGGSYEYFKDKTTEAEEKILDFGTATKSIYHDLQNTTSGLKAFSNEYINLNKPILDHLNNLKKLSETYPEITNKVQDLAIAYDKENISKEELLDQLSKLETQYKTIGDGLQGYGKYMDETTGATEEQALALEELNSKLANGEITIDEYNKALEGMEQQTDSAADSVKNLRGDFNDLIDTIFDGINANNELQEAEWAQVAAQEALNKLIKEGKEGTQEYEQALNDLDAADQKVLESQYKVYTSIFTTKEEQEAARIKALEYGLQMVDSGKWGEEAFAKLAEKFGLSAEDISKFAAIMSSDLDEATKQREIKILLDTSEVAPKVYEAQRVLDSLKNKEVTVTTKYKYESYEERYGSGKQSGGEVEKTGWIPDLNIIGIKGEGFLTREIMNAIKTGRTDYMGVSGRGERAASITNSFIITGNIIREEADIDKITTQITRKIYDMQQIKEMGMG